ncbi:hypothetical protein [Aliikangiella sp. IMCC44359]|uniref:hypothetical protein n=1 Tax=Aliikangiella sp. IMCC44359 TaxID=3459125 RepID=UPI00403AD277
MKKLLFTLFLLASYSVSSAEIWHASKIKTIYPLGNGDFVLQFYEDSPACTSNTSPDYYYVSVGINGVTAEASKKFYSLAMSTAVAKTPITINFDDSTSSCNISRLLASY